MKLWQTATGEPWAMTACALQTVLDIASRKMGLTHESIDAIAARVGHDLENAHTTTVREGVAVIPLVGPLFRYANLFTRVSGATSYELLAQDFITALDDPDISSIVFNIDSPGGEVNGCAELAQLIADARGIKPIIAYVSGDAASGAYWIASACDEIVISSTSGLGSIGVVGVYRIDDEDNQNKIEIVSSQSPLKRLDLSNDDDKAIVQSRIDALAAVFVESVATYRGVDASVVIAKYGGGDVFIGEQAVRCGLADRLGSFEKVLQELNATDPATERGFAFLGTPKTLSTTEELPMADDETEKITTPVLTLEAVKADYPELAATMVAEGHSGGLNEGVIQGRSDERKRIGAILNADSATGRESLARHFAFETDLSVESVLAALDASPMKAAAAPVADNTSPGFEQVMATIDNPAIEPTADHESLSETDTLAATAQRIAGCHKPKGTNTV